MNWRNLANTNGQQAPTGRPTVSARQSTRLGPSHTASMSRKRTAGGTSTSRSSKPRSVSTVLSTLPNRRQRRKPSSPRVAKGGGSGAISSRRTKAVSIAASAFAQPHAGVVPVHQHARDQRDREIDRHGDGDDLDRLVSLVERRAGKDREQVGIADRDRERGVLGEIEILIGERWHDHAQRLRHDDQAQDGTAP